MAYSTEKVNQNLAKLPLNFNGDLAKLQSTPLVKLATGVVGSHSS